MNLAVLKPFTSRTGEIIRFSEIFVNENTGEIQYRYKEYPVLLSNNTNIIYASEHGRLSYLDIRKFKKREWETNQYNIIGEPHVWRRKFGFKYSDLQDGIVASCYSFYSKRINDNKTKKALNAYIRKEFGAFSRMADALKSFQIPKSAEQGKK